MRKGGGEVGKGGIFATACFMANKARWQCCGSSSMTSTGLETESQKTKGVLAASGYQMVPSLVSLVSYPLGRVRAEHSCTFRCEHWTEVLSNCTVGDSPPWEGLLSSLTSKSLMNNVSLPLI